MLLSLVGEAGSNSTQLLYFNNMAKRVGLDFRHLAQIVVNTGHKWCYPVFMRVSSTFSTSALLPAKTSNDLY